MEVWRGGFDAPHKFVRSTLANGVPVHGRCEADPTREGFSRGYFTCATSLPVLPDATGVLELVTEASEALDGPSHEGSLLSVKLTRVCTRVGAAPRNAVLCDGAGITAAAALCRADRQGDADGARQRPDGR